MTIWLITMSPLGLTGTADVLFQPVDATHRLNRSRWQAVRILKIVKLNDRCW